MKTVITYGTFDIFHIGHLQLLRRAREMGDRLLVGISTDEFNAGKGKKSVFSFEDRSAIVASSKYVADVFPETNWDQKRSDIKKHNATVFLMGSDWEGKFDELRDLCEVVYLPRTEGISSTEVKQLMAKIDSNTVEQLKTALNLAQRLISGIS